MSQHPKYYKHGEYAVIDIIEELKLPFSLGSAFTHIVRAVHKEDGDTVKDLETAIFYLKNHVKHVKEKMEDLGTIKTGQEETEDSEDKKEKPYDAKDLDMNERMTLLEENFAELMTVLTSPGPMNEKETEVQG